MIQQEFDKLTAFEQWKWVIENKEKIQEVTLDNDNTAVTLKNTEDYYLDMKSDCGNREGVEFILIALGLNARHC